MCECILQMKRREVAVWSLRLQPIREPVNLGAQFVVVLGKADMFCERPAVWLPRAKQAVRFATNTRVTVYVGIFFYYSG